MHRPCLVPRPRVLLELEPLPLRMVLAIVGIAAAYVLVSEQATAWFYRPTA